MNQATKDHVLAFDDPDALREHLRKHTVDAGARRAIDEADHRSLDALHIEMHERAR